MRRVLPVALATTLLFTIGAVVLGQSTAAPPGAAARRAPPAPVQPLPYSHRQHVEFGLECQECHVNPDPGTLMTYPATAVCMSCHRTIPTGYASLQKLAGLAASGAPIPWVRVYQLPDYVYWDHRTHLAAGLACETCHGPVADRDVLAQETDIVTMRGCQACHEKRQVYTDCGDCHEPRQ
jgi:Cytochrome c7 and related cytochrome c